MKYLGKRGTTSTVAMLVALASIMVGALAYAQEAEPGAPRQEPLLLGKHPGATAAYSLQKLNNKYDGPAINVRRSSDNTLKDIGFDGSKLDVKALKEFVGAGDGAVVTWYDQSGNGSNLTRRNYNPLIMKKGVLVKSPNGGPAIHFDGTQNLPAEFPKGLDTHNVSVFAVAKMDDAAKIHSHGGLLALDNYRFIAYNLSPHRGIWQMRVGDGKKKFGKVSFGKIAIRKPSVFTFTAKDGNMSVWHDAQACGKAQATKHPSLKAKRLVLGATQSAVWIGAISTVLVYAAQDDAQRAAIDRQLLALHGLNATKPQEEKK
jgi:hypothetical protein